MVLATMIEKPPLLKKKKRTIGMVPKVSMRQALSDPQLLGKFLEGDSWKAWRVLLIASMGEKLTSDERTIFTKLTRREREPDRRVDELVAVIGRRGGKSRAMATLACYIATLCEHSLDQGERGVALLIAPDQRQSGIALDYASACLEQSPILRDEIVSRSSSSTNKSINLQGNISIEVRSASYRRLRGPTYIVVIADEAAFWYSEESSNPDVEIINAVRPGLATTNGPLIIASSPYARKGILWEAFRRNYKPDGDEGILVARGTSRELNPSLSQKIIDRAMERDPAHARAEYLCEFRTDIESFVSREVVEGCIRSDLKERPPLPHTRYVAFVDMSGGSVDSAALAVGHYNRIEKTVVLDYLKEIRAPHSPEGAVETFAGILQNYKISRVVGDRYGGEWPVEAFAHHGIKYDVAEKPKSDLYQTLLAMLNSARVDLLNDHKLVNQLVGLERRTRSGGKETIDHALSRGSHDDVANACAGVVYYLSKRAWDPSYSGRAWDGLSGDATSEAERREQEKSAREWRRAQIISVLTEGRGFRVL